MEYRCPKTNRMITLTKTVYGNIELDFNNTKIIRNGKILSLDEAENPNNEGATVEQLSKAKEMENQ
jgi:hypothetical protein